MSKGWKNHWLSKEPMRTRLEGDIAYLFRILESNQLEDVRTSRIKDRLLSIAKDYYKDKDHSNDTDR